MQVALWLTVPADCRMVGEFEVGDDAPDIKVILGSSHDDVNLLFAREALERFVELAQRMLEIPLQADSRAVPPTVLVAHYGYDIREESKHAA
jgi:hypothetical protein